MIRFKKKKEQMKVATASQIKIVAHKNATQKVVEQAKQANSQLKNLLDENGFTIKIFLAAGGKTKRKVRHEH